MSSLFVSYPCAGTVPAVIPVQEPTPGADAAKEYPGPTSNAVGDGVQQFGVTAVGDTGATHSGDSVPGPDPNAAMPYGPSFYVPPPGVEQLGRDSPPGDAGALPPQQTTPGTEVPTYPQGGDGVIETVPTGRQYYADHAGTPLDMRVPDAADPTPPGMPNSSTWLTSPEQIVLTNVEGKQTIVR